MYSFVLSNGFLVIFLSYKNHCLYQKYNIFKRYSTRLNVAWIQSSSSSFVSVKVAKTIINTVRKLVICIELGFVLYYTTVPPPFALDNIYEDVAGTTCYIHNTYIWVICGSPFPGHDAIPYCTLRLFACT